MPSSATVILLGHLGSDPEKRYSQDGKPNTTFRMAVDDGKRDDKHSSWYRVVVFGRDAEYIAERATKGTLVQVVGRLSTGLWKPDSGEPRVNLDVVADKVQIAGPAGDKSAPHMAEMGAAIYPETQDAVSGAPVTSDLPW